MLYRCMKGKTRDLLLQQQPLGLVLALVVSSPILPTFLVTPSFPSRQFFTVSRQLHFAPRVLFIFSSQLSFVAYQRPVSRFFYRRMSVRPPVLLLFVPRRVFYLIWYFVVRSTVYNCLPCVLPLLVLASVRLSRIFGRVFGYQKCLVVGSALRSVLQCVRLLQVFGRVFGCFKCLAGCSAVF